MATIQVDYSLAHHMIETAVAYCAGKMPGGDVARARRALGRGKCDVCDYLCYSLSRQVGEYLGQMDARVKAIYLFEPEYAEAGEIEAMQRTPGIHLIAWADRKSAALNALVASLAAIVTESLRQELGCIKASPACYALDVQIVDDDDVTYRRGFGTLVESVYVRPIRVWARAN